MKSNKRIKKVLLLGSGALKIGQAGEFDYSGSQAIKALKEEGVEVILFNPNIATVQTSWEFADKVYFLPIKLEFLASVIDKERPDGILLSFGGQTALNAGIELAKEGILKKYHVTVLGTPVETIKDTEDRERFNQKLEAAGFKYPQGEVARDWSSAKKIAGKLGYPLIVRSGYTLGGKGSALVYNLPHLKEAVKSAFVSSSHVVIEEYLKHWKEIEYEVVRDASNNCVTICNMENFDPMGVHTGESIVVAPSQTLTNFEYHRLREVAIKLIRKLGIVGECNIQFALNPKKFEWRIIEVNARLSRSSALASKATGYPIAYVAAKLALGKTLDKLTNSVTGSTSAFFEPALDYVTVKIPRWDMEKFRNASERIDSSMKSVGEVMAIGRKFEEALQKAVRMLDIGLDGLVGLNDPDLKTCLTTPSTKRLFYIMTALRRRMSVQRVNELSGVDPWFLSKIKNIVAIEKELSSLPLGQELLRRAKKFGFSDKQTAHLSSSNEHSVRNLRNRYKIFPVVKLIDTLAAEYPAKTNYCYLTYNGTEDELPVGKRKKALVLGSGPYRIGSSVEFDWCCVTTSKALREKDWETVLINCNPETVSTDYDSSDRLYFEELTFETIADLYGKEKPRGVIVSMGGQAPNNVALSLSKWGANILGTKSRDIDRAEDRYKFSALLDKLGIDQPLWQELKTTKTASKFASKIGYPVLVRPSYVLSGAAMEVAYNEEDLRKFLVKATKLSKDHPVVVSKFVENVKEIEIDAVAAGGKLIIYAISEHVENAGVHSGDATVVLPAQRLYLETVRKVLNYSKKIAHELQINGPFNIQFLAQDNDVLVIECNLRASRSFPFVSKVTGYNFAEVATRAMLGESIAGKFETTKLNYVGVKSPQFSFSRILGADPILRVEMSSTGEVACFGENIYEAYLKSLLAAGFRLPRKSVFLSLGGEENKFKFIESARKIKSLGLKVFATEKTAAFFNRINLKCTKLYKLHESRSPNLLDFLKNRKIDLVINVTDPQVKKEVDDDYFIRRAAIDWNVGLFTNLQSADLLIESLSRNVSLSFESWDYYLEDGRQSVKQS
jgi:carbamoyl-phosphate synthase large subunit